jgi:hypothetical protein
MERLAYRPLADKREQFFDFPPQFPLYKFPQRPAHNSARRLPENFFEPTVSEKYLPV